MGLHLIRPKLKNQGLIHMTAFYSRFIAILLLITGLLASNPSSADEHSDEDNSKKAILVTGATSGLGLKMTETLSKAGYTVYAGARKDADMKRLEAMENVEAIRIDVTIQSQIDAAVKTIESKGRGLYGLINNAGVAVFGPIAEVDVSELEYQMNVNVYGPYRVTQAFLPLLKESKGRIATTGSIAGIRASRFFSHYAMSKHSVEAFTESLSVELEQYGITVGVIEPGNYASQIGNTARKRILEKDYWAESSDYSDGRKGVLTSLAQVDQGNDPQDVADAALHFMSNDEPKFRYMVTADHKQSHAIVRAMIQKTIQLNQGHDYTLDKAALIKILEEELAK